MWPKAGTGSRRSSFSPSSVPHNNAFYVSRCRCAFLLPPSSPSLGRAVLPGLVVFVFEQKRLVGLSRNRGRRTGPTACDVAKISEKRRAWVVSAKPRCSLPVSPCFRPPRGQITDARRWFSSDLCATYSLGGRHLVGPFETRFNNEINSNHHRESFFRRAEGYFLFLQEFAPLFLPNFLRPVLDPPTGRRLLKR